MTTLDRFPFEPSDIVADQELVDFAWGCSLYELGMVPHRQASADTWDGWEFAKSLDQPVAYLEVQL